MPMVATDVCTLYSLLLIEPIAPDTARKPPRSRRNAAFWSPEEATVTGAAAVAGATVAGAAATGAGGGSCGTAATSTPTPNSNGADSVPSMFATITLHFAGRAPKLVLRSIFPAVTDCGTRSGNRRPVEVSTRTSLAPGRKFAP